jgi:hypothetical protein
MEKDKKAESNRVVGYFCLGFALLLLIGAIVFMSSNRLESGFAFLVIGLTLLTVGTVAVAAGKRKNTPPS